MSEKVLLRGSTRSITWKVTTKGRATGVKPVERGQRMTGRIVGILYGHGYGFIRARDHRQLFFHRRDVPVARFNALAVGDRVAFEFIEDKLAGPRAVNVKPAALKKRNGLQVDARRD